MRLIDMHCDTLWKLTDKAFAREEKEDLKENHCCISIPGMKKAGTLAQFFACFTYVGGAEGGYEECYGQVFSMAGYLKGQCGLYGEDMGLALSYTDVARNEREGKISAILTVEEGGVVNGKMERVGELYREGVRLLTPMWNYENCFGYPNSREAEAMGRGLKPFGKEAVEYASSLGMVLDVSHASDGCFYDILDCAKGPVVASHSNCRAVCGHPRNLSDEMIRRLSEAGGVAGLNFYGTFLSGAPESRLEAMTAHILHMIRVGGSGFPAIGTDFDGYDGMEREDIPRAEEMEKLWDALKKAGIRESQIDKISRENAENVLKRL